MINILFWIAMSLIVGPIFIGMLYLMYETVNDLI